MARYLRIQYASDIHLEHQQAVTPSLEKWLQPAANVDALVLAGDIGRPELPEYRQFIKGVSAAWPKVFLVAGNHEFYGSAAYSPDTLPRSKKLQLLRSICEETPNVHFLDRSAVEIAPGVKILGATLWSDIPESMWKYAGRSLNDFHMIRPDDERIAATTDDYSEWHQTDRDWLRKELQVTAERGESAIVVTHHLPTTQLIHEKYAEHPLNCCFATNLEELFAATTAAPLAWICGHSHTGKKIVIGNTQLALNPWGYPGERVNTRNREAVLEIALPSA